MKKIIILMFSSLIIMMISLSGCSEKMSSEPEPEIKLANLYGTIVGDGVIVPNDPVRDVEITLINSDSSESYTISDENGEFVFDSLSIGEYRIKFFKEVAGNNNLYLTDFFQILDSTDVIDTFYFKFSEPEIKLASLYGTIKGDGILVYSDPFKDVEITLIDEDSSKSYTTSNTQGLFIFDSLAIGEYRLEFEKQVPFNNYLYHAETITIVDSNDVDKTFYFSSFKDDYFPIDSGVVWEYLGTNDFWPAPGGEYLDSVTIRINITGRSLNNGTVEYQATSEKTVFWKYIHFGYIGGEFVEDTSFYTNEVTISSGNYIEKEGLIYNFFYPGFHAYPKGNEFFKEVFGCPSFCFLYFNNGNPFMYKGELYNTIQIDVDPGMTHNIYEYVKDIGLVTIRHLRSQNSVSSDNYILVNHAGTD